MRIVLACIQSNGIKVGKVCDRGGNSANGIAVTKMLFYFPSIVVTVLTKTGQNVLLISYKQYVDILSRTHQIHKLRNLINLSLTLQKT